MSSAVRCLSAVVAILAITVRARAGISAPNSSFQVSGDGTRILVMLSPQRSYDRTPIATLPDGRNVDVHDTFPKSGLYSTSTLKPEWQVDWFALRRDLLCSDDLQHVARLNRQGFGSRWAVAFYQGGKQTRTYDCSSLLTSMNSDWCLPYSTWDWHVQWYEDFHLDQDGTRVFLSTARRRTCVMGHPIDLGRQELYEFDFATGNLVSQRIVGARVLWAYASVFASLALALAYATKSLVQRIKQSNHRHTRPAI